MSFPTRRLRRLRTSEKMRELIQQTTLSPKDFICPVFVEEDLKTRVKVESMSEIERLPLDDVNDEVGTISDLGIPAISAANILAAMGGMSIVGNFVLGNLGDRIGNRQLFIIGFINPCLPNLRPSQLWLRLVWARGNYFNQYDHPLSNQRKNLRKPLIN